MYPVQTQDLNVFKVESNSTPVRFSRSSLLWCITGARLYDLTQCTNQMLLESHPTPPTKQRRIIVEISDNKRQVDDFVGDLTFSNHLIDRLCEIILIVEIGLAVPELTFDLATSEVEMAPSPPRRRARKQRGKGGGRAVQGYLAHKKTPTPLGPR